MLNVTRLVIFGCVAILFILVAASALAQQPAKIKGVLVAPNDAVVPGAIVRIESETIKRRIQSNESGEFELELPPDFYEVSVESSGFKSYFITGYQIRADVSPKLIIHLETEPSYPCPIINLEVSIEAVQARVFQKMGPRKLE